MSMNIVLAIGNVMIRRQYSDEENIPPEYYANLELLKFPEDLHKRGLCYDFIIPPAVDSTHIEVPYSTWKACMHKSKFKHNALHGIYCRSERPDDFICNDNLSNRQTLRRMLVSIEDDKREGLSSLLDALRDVPITGTQHISVTLVETT